MVYPVLIVPHNRYLSVTTDRLLRNFSPPDNIVIIGPNHTDVGEDISENNSHDHSISTPLEVIRNVFPSAAVKNITLKKFRSETKLNNLYDNLSSNFSRTNTLYIFSVDFAHYLDKTQSLGNDKTTIELIDNKNLAEITKLSTDYTDCPNCLGLVSMFASEKVQVINNLWLDGTSYIWGIIK